MKLSKLLLASTISLLFLSSACSSPKTQEQTSAATANSSETASAAAPAEDISYSFGAGRMGKAKIGMDKAAFFAAYPNAKNGTYASEAEEIPTWEAIDADGKVLFAALLGEGTEKISGFSTENPKMQNAEKIHFGSNYVEVVAAYKELIFTNAEGLTIAPKNNAYFNMRVSGIEVDYNEDGSISKATHVERDASVGEIWVYK